MLFSATIDRQVADTVKNSLKDPAFVEIAHRGDTAETIEQHVIRIPPPQEAGAAALRARAPRLHAHHRLRAHEGRLRRRGARPAPEGLPRRAHPLEPLAGEAPPGVAALQGRPHLACSWRPTCWRAALTSRTWSTSSTTTCPTCLTTTSTASCRTGRAGKSGDALSFVSPKGERNLKSIERLIGEKIPALTLDDILSLPVLEQPQYNDAPERAPARQAPRRQPLRRRPPARASHGQEGRAERAQGRRPRQEAAAPRASGRASHPREGGEGGAPCEEPRERRRGRQQEGWREGHWRAVRQQRALGRALVQHAERDGGPRRRHGGRARPEGREEGESARRPQARRRGGLWRGEAQPQASRVGRATRNNLPPNTLLSRM